MKCRSRPHRRINQLPERLPSGARKREAKTGAMWVRFKVLSSVCSGRSSWRSTLNAATRAPASTSRYVGPLSRTITGEGGVEQHLQVHIGREGYRSGVAGCRDAKVAVEKIVRQHQPSVLGLYSPHNAELQMILEIREAGPGSNRFTLHRRGRRLDRGSPDVRCADNSHFVVVGAEDGVPTVAPADSSSKGARSAVG